METIKSSECVEANRGPLTQCQQFPFLATSFGNDSASYQSFTYENAYVKSGYREKNAA